MWEVLIPQRELEQLILNLVKTRVNYQMREMN